MKINYIGFSVDCITQSELITGIVFPFCKIKIKYNQNIHTDFSIYFYIKW